MQESKKKELLLVCFLISLLLIILSILFTSISPPADLSYYDPTAFNLIFYVHVSFWAGTFMLNFLIIFLFLKPCKASKTSDSLIVISTIAILTAFYALPYLIEPNPRFVDSWVHGRTANAILLNGYLNTNEFNYQTYPLSFLFLSITSTITSIEITTLLRILPLLVILLFFSFLIIFLKKLLGNWKLAAISVLIFGLSTFYLSFHFSPEIFGWLFFFLLLISLASFVQKGCEKFVSKKNLLVSLFFIVGIALAHPVTQVYVALMVLILSIFGLLIWKHRYITFRLAILAIIIFTIWALTFGYVYFDEIVRSFGMAFEKIYSDIASSIIARPLQEVTPAQVTNLLLYRRSLYLFVITGGLIGGFFFRKQNSTQFNFLFSLVLVGTLLLPLTVYGILPLERSIKIAFVPLSVFSAFFFFQKKRLGALLLIFLLIPLPVNFASFYWGETRCMTHNWELTSALFISNNFHGVALGEFKETSIWKYFGSFEKVYNDYFLYGARPDVFNMSFIEQKSIELLYITHFTILKERQLGKELNVNSFSNSSRFNCIYSNGYSVVFLVSNFTAQ